MNVQCPRCFSSMFKLNYSHVNGKLKPVSCAFCEDSLVGPKDFFQKKIGSIENPVCTLMVATFSCNPNISREY